MNRYPLSDSLSHKTINPPPPPPRLDLILALTSTPTGASHAAALATVCDSFARDLHAVHLSYRALLARLAWSDAPPPLSPPHTARRALGSLHVDALRAKLAAGVHLSAGFAVGILHREIERLVLSGCKRIVVSGVEIVQESEGEDGVGGLRVLALLETKVRDLRLPIGHPATRLSVFFCIVCGRCSRRNRWPDQLHICSACCRIRSTKAGGPTSSISWPGERRTRSL